MLGPSARIDYGFFSDGTQSSSGFVSWIVSTPCSSAMKTGPTEANRAAGFTW